jgi:hypothetical protein
MYIFSNHRTMKNKLSEKALKEAAKLQTGLWSREIFGSLCFGVFGVSRKQIRNFTEK